MPTYFQILRLLRENILQGNTLNKLQKFRFRWNRG